MTKKTQILCIFAPVEAHKSIAELHIIAFTHRNLSVNEIGELHIDENFQQERLTQLKEKMGLKELLFLSTCNRVEFMFTTSQSISTSFLDSFFQELYPDFSKEKFEHFAKVGNVFHGMAAVNHTLSVASSLDSMIVGEREIITQVRNAYENARKMKLSGDFIRILIRHTIETAKKVYTETSIATRPVSIVSLAYHKLKELDVPLDARILIVGAGVTNTNMTRFLKKHGFTNFNVFNRTPAKAIKLAEDINGNGHSLTQLNTFNKGFDIILTCTGAEEHIITPEIYTQLAQGETGNKIVVDLAIPQDLAPEIKEKNNLTHISIELLQQISNENLKARTKEVIHVEEILSEAITEFEFIHHNRSVEIAMREVPKKVKQIKMIAMEEVFHNELNELDENSREVLEKIVGYMEKKYMSMPMLMAKEILLKEHPKSFRSNNK